MSNATLYLQKALLDHSLGLAPYAMPTAYLGLTTSDPGELGAAAGEVTGGSYARVEISSKMAATVLATGVAINSAVITFPGPTAAWGTVAFWSVFDAASGGNMLLYGPLTASHVINSGDLPKNFPINRLSITAPSTSLGQFESQATQYHAKKWLDHALGIAAFTMPSGAHLGAFTADPGATGSLAGEVAGGGYGRQPITSKMDFTTLATGISVNNDAVVFATPSANWGFVTHFGIMDAAAAGNMLWRRARETGITVVAGAQPVSVSPGQLVLRAA